MTRRPNPIADLLGLSHMRQNFWIGAAGYEFHPASDGIAETLYRLNPGHAVGNPGFSLGLTPESHHAMQLGQYLAGRQGVKRADAERITHRAPVLLTVGRPLRPVAGVAP